MRYSKAITLASLMILAACSGGGQVTDISSSGEGSQTTVITGASQSSDQEQAVSTSTTGAPPETTDPSDQGPVVDTASFDACGLLTEDEITAILGSLPEGDSETLGFDAACYWEVVEDDGTYKQLSVELADLGESAVEEYQNWKENVTVLEDSVAIGDEAFLSLYSVGGSSLIIRDGGLIVFIQTSLDDHGETIKGLGPLVLGRLTGA